jgi:predicted PhzF superfamily epimerase YddE/YHI9
MRLRTYIIDAFVRDGQPGTGNAAGVVLLPSVVSNNDDDAPTSNSTTSDKPLSLDNAARQRLAAELRQTETAFVERRSADKEEKGRFLLRWFTPTTEVPLCGHATLAAAAALFAEGVEGSKEEEEEEQGEGNATTRDLVYCFETVSSGLLKVRVRFPPAAPPRSLSSSPAFELDLPSRQPNASLPFGPSGGGGDRKVALLRALQGRGTRALEPSFAGLSFNAALRYLVVSLRDGGDVCAREVIEGLRPDLGALRAAVSRRGGDKDNDDDSNSSVSGVIVTAVGSEEGEETIFSRFFAPWMGIDEVKEKRRDEEKTKRREVSFFSSFLSHDETSQKKTSKKHLQQQTTGPRHGLSARRPRSAVGVSPGRPGDAGAPGSRGAAPATAVPGEAAKRARRGAYREPAAEGEEGARLGSGRGGARRVVVLVVGWDVDIPALRRCAFFFFSDPGL